MCEKNRDQLLPIRPLLWSPAGPFYGGSEGLPAKPRASPEVTAENPVAKMQLLAWSLATGNVPRAARPACPGKGGMARRLSCPSSHLSLLRAGEIRFGVMMACLGSLRTPRSGMSARSPVI